MVHLPTTRPGQATGGVGERACEREGGTGRESEGRSYPSSTDADLDIVSSATGLSRKAGQSVAEA